MRYISVTKRVKRVLTIVKLVILRTLTVKKVYFKSVLTKNPAQK